MYNSQIDKVTQFRLDPDNKYIRFINKFDDAYLLLDDPKRELFKRFFLMVKQERQ